MAYIIIYVMYSDRDKSWPILFGESYGKSVKTYPGLCRWTGMIYRKYKALRNPTSQKKARISP